MIPQALRRIPPLRTLALCASLLAGCGGGGGAPATPAPPDAAAAGTLSAGPGCALRYALTDSPLLAGADPLLARQWHLQNTGQSGGTPGEDARAVAAWAVTRGEGARVAVIDDSIEVLHPALRPNVVEGASYSYREGNRGTPWPLPCVEDEGHGTAVAGIVAARDGDAEGGAGVAPRASLVAFDALASGTDADIADALTRGFDATQVFHNSWGSPDDGALHPTGAAFAAAIESGIATGRGGRGAVYVFSAGNGGCYGRRPTPGNPCLTDDSNYDGYVNRRGIVAVCAVDDTGRQPGYGETGANLTVCAPSSNTSAARPVGVTSPALRAAWRDDFTGTSASAPMVSGVVALMLSVRPELTWRDVRLLLAQTARRNDPTDPGWEPAADGLAFNHKYGFGVVDAQAAVAAARAWTPVGGTAALRTCRFDRSPNRAIPDAPGAAVTDAIDAGGCPITKIEWVEVRVTAPHQYSGDLRIRLTSPASRVSRLAEGRICASGCGDYADWPFGSMRHLGESAAGTWTLSVADTDATATGTLQTWSLVIHGR